MALCGSCGEDKVCPWGCKNCAYKNWRGMPMCDACNVWHGKFLPKHCVVTSALFAEYCATGRTAICDLHDDEDITYYCSTCTEFGCNVCRQAHSKFSCKNVDLRAAAQSAKEEILQLSETLGTQKEILVDDISVMMGLSELRLAQVGVLRLKIDEEANLSIEKLNTDIQAIDDVRKQCHKDLDSIISEQDCKIRSHVAALENRLENIVECEKSLQHSDLSDKETIEHSTKIGVILKQIFNSLEHEQCDFIKKNQPVVEVQLQVISSTYNVPVVTIIAPVGDVFRVKDFAQLIMCDDPTDIDVLTRNDTNSLTIVSVVSGQVKFFDSITGNLETTIATSSTQMYSLALMASSKPLLFVSWSDRNKIAVFDVLSGQLINTIGSAGTGEGQLCNPFGLFLRQFTDKSTLLYVADRDNGRVQVFEADTGKYSQFIGRGINRFDPNRIAYFGGNDCAKDPLLVVTNCNNHKVHIFHADTGAEMRIIGNGQAGSASGQLNCPGGVTVCPMGNDSEPLLLVSEYDNHRIQVFNLISGVSLKCLCEQGREIGQLNHPRGLQLLCSNKIEISVLVADSGNRRVQKIVISL